MTSIRVFYARLFCNFCVCRGAVQGLMLVAFLILAGSSVSAQLQQSDNTADEDAKLAQPVVRAFGYGELEAMTIEQLTKLYNDESEVLRQVCKDLRREGTRFFHATSIDSAKHSKIWQKHADLGKKTFQRLKEISLVLYLKTPEPDLDLARMARIMYGKSFEEGRLGICYEVNKKLVKSFPDEQEVADDFARIAAYTNDFDTAADFLESNKATVLKFPIFDSSLFANLDKQRERWARELELRKKEAKADNLPRVEIVTSKGSIVVELFEDHAPGTVGNFVSLVEQEFYQDLIFHLVMRNYRAQGGIVTQDQVRETGYEIFDESTLPDARSIFRGSICMSHPIAAKGASEFFINLSPEPFLETKAMPTVIGRVIEGMEVVEALNVTAKLEGVGPKVLKEAQPDVILSTKVLRKREGSVYEPKIDE
ncbi:MAG: peptidylprolyl isomerase [Planctomycetota bacterium]